MSDPRPQWPGDWLGDDDDGEQTANDRPDAIPTCGVCKGPRPQLAGHEECVRIASGGRMPNLRAEAVAEYVAGGHRQGYRGKQRPRSMQPSAPRKTRAR